MFRRLLGASLLHQPLHSILVAGVAAVAGCVLTGLLSVTLPIEDELQSSLRAFGANLAVEPAAALGLAALQTGAYQPRGGEKVCLVICGANLDPATLA